MMWRTCLFIGLALLGVQCGRDEAPPATPTAADVIAASPEDVGPLGTNDEDVSADASAANGPDAAEFGATVAETLTVTDVVAADAGVRDGDGAGDLGTTTDGAIEDEVLALADTGDDLGDAPVDITFDASIVEVSDVELAPGDILEDTAASVDTGSATDVWAETVAQDGSSDATATTPVDVCSSTLSSVTQVSYPACLGITVPSITEGPTGCQTARLAYYQGAKKRFVIREPGGVETLVPTGDYAFDWSDDVDWLVAPAGAVPLSANELLLSRAANATGSWLRRFAMTTGKTYDRFVGAKSPSLPDITYEDAAPGETLGVTGLVAFGPMAIAGTRLLTGAMECRDWVIVNGSLTVSYHEILTGTRPQVFFIDMNKYPPVNPAKEEKVPIQWQSFPAVPCGFRTRNIAAISTTDVVVLAQTRRGAFQKELWVHHQAAPKTPWLTSQPPPNHVPVDVRQGRDGVYYVIWLDKAWQKRRSHVRGYTSTGVEVSVSADVPDFGARVDASKNGDLYVATNFGPIYWLSAAQGVVPLPGTVSPTMYDAPLVVVE